MRDCRVETVDHVSDSDSEERDSNQPPTIALHPSHQGPPTYLLMSSKQEKVKHKKSYLLLSMYLLLHFYKLFYPITGFMAVSSYCSFWKWFPIRVTI